jgi:hypothetical protein
MPFHRAVLAALVVALVAPSAASAHKGDPHYLSVVRAVAPSVPGLSVVMLNRNDRLLVTNHGPRTVVFMGYNKDPYLRFLPSGVVQRNVLSPSTYLNVDATGSNPVPASADEHAAPRWQTVSEDGKFEFHDHRIHWMGTQRPPVVTNPDKKTKVQDWAVPFRAGEGAPGAVTGTLYWTPLGGGGFPVGAIVALVLLAVGGGVLVVLVRRRRAATEEDSPDTDDSSTESREAW